MSGLDTAHERQGQQFSLGLACLNTQLSVLPGCCTGCAQKVCSSVHCLQMQDRNAVNTSKRHFLLGFMPATLKFPVLIGQLALDYLGTHEVRLNANESL